MSIVGYTAAFLSKPQANIAWFEQDGLPTQPGHRWLMQVYTMLMGIDGFLDTQYAQPSIAQVANQAQAIAETVARNETAAATANILSLIASVGDAILAEALAASPPATLDGLGAAPRSRPTFEQWVTFPSYAVASVPSAVTAGAGAMIYVSDEAGGPTLAFSNGTNWLRTLDNAVIS